MAQSFDRWFVAPLGWPRLGLVALVVWVAGGVYCQGYQVVMAGGGDWPGALLWSAYSVVPWLALVEAVKWSGWCDRWSSLRILAAAVAVGMASISIEVILRTLAADGFPPAHLIVMRRLPPMMAALLLIAVGKRLATSSRGGSASPSQRLGLLAPSVQWIAAADNYVELHLGDRSELLRMTMSATQKQLEKRGFRRIHRRYIVNASQIERVEDNGGAIRLRDGTCLPVGKAYSAEIRYPN